MLTKHNHPTSQCPGDPEEMAECSGPPCPTTTRAPTTTTTTSLPNLKVEINSHGFSCSLSLSIRANVSSLATLRTPFTTCQVRNHQNYHCEILSPTKILTGTVFTLGEDRLLIEDFTYDGNGPDAFFYIGTEGAITKKTRTSWNRLQGNQTHVIGMDFSTIDLAGSPGPRGLVLAHPFEGKYYDYRDPRVSPKPYNLNWTLPHPGPPHLLGNTRTRRPLQQHLALEKYFAPPRWRYLPTRQKWV